MPGDMMRQILERMRALEDEVKLLQARERNIDRIALRDGIAAPGSVTGIGFLFIDSADGDLKVIYGDGTTKLIVVDT